MYFSLIAGIQQKSNEKRCLFPATSFVSPVEVSKDDLASKAKFKEIVATELEKRTNIIWLKVAVGCVSDLKSLS